MPSLLENLIGESVRRKDNKLYVPAKRPIPSRPRDLFELFGALGDQARMETLLRSIPLKEADPKRLTLVFLSRWPLEGEIEPGDEAYQPGQHLRQLLGHPEFRRPLARRILDAYPERQRLLHVRIPRCANDHLLAVAVGHSPILPANLGEGIKSTNEFLTVIGKLLRRFASTRGTFLSSPSLHPFIQASPAPDEPGPLAWGNGAPAYRIGDRLFTIIREPKSLVLSQINTIIATLRQSGEPGAQGKTDWQNRLGALPRTPEEAAWKEIGRRILALLPTRNILCTALGDGTAKGAIELCRRSDIQITDLTVYPAWLGITFNTEPEPPTNRSDPVLLEADLGEADLSRLADITSEDQAFYARFLTALTASETPAIAGSAL